jgi:hypothetical protein
MTCLYAAFTAPDPTASPQCHGSWPLIRVRYPTRSADLPSGGGRRSCWPPGNRGDVLALQLLGLQIDLSLENLWGGLSHLGGDGQRGAADVRGFGACKMFSINHLQRSRTCLTMRSWLMGFLLLRQSKVEGFTRIIHGPSPYHLKAHPVSHRTLELQDFSSRVWEWENISVLDNGVFYKKAHSCQEDLIFIFNDHNLGQLDDDGSLRSAICETPLPMLPGYGSCILLSPCKMCRGYGSPY